VGGLGSISAYPYKTKWNGDPWIGDRFVQLNTEFIFAPEFLDDDWTLILFADAGDAWMSDEYDITNVDSIINNGKSAIGIGFGSSDHDDIDWRVNIARPLDGTDYWESTLRINFNF
ncbi:MAG: BamA/TamA family outer membrane protein, partial [Candidatus Marinimicrobia bacterium]|nr:BamA/TamA family outer membrane protein [Candidatus Neomarinimicrobiota bacterium]